MHTISVYSGDSNVTISLVLFRSHHQSTSNNIFTFKLRKRERERPEYINLAAIRCASVQVLFSV